VNWWATWPAEQRQGVLISERAYFRLEAGGPPDREVSPPEEFERLRAQFPEFLRQHPKENPAAAGRDPGSAGVELDAYHLDRAEEGWRGGRWPLVAVYLNGGDLIASGFKAPEHPAGSIRRAAALVQHLDFLDARLRDLAASLSGGDLLLIEGDPGRNSDLGSDSGFLLLTGRGIEPRKTLRGDLLDVAPTLLRIAGLPLSREMKGKPVEACLDRSVFGEVAPPSVASYGERRPSDSRASDFDPEVLERLRSLGYIR
jgi:hypothetical protein